MIVSLIYFYQISSNKLCIYWLIRIRTPSSVYPQGCQTFRLSTENFVSAKFCHWRMKFRQFRLGQMSFGQNVYLQTVCYSQTIGKLTIYWHFWKTFVCANLWLKGWCVIIVTSFPPPPAHQLFWEGGFSHGDIFVGAFLAWRIKSCVVLKSKNQWCITQWVQSTLHRYPR